MEQSMNSNNSTIPYIYVVVVVVLARKHGGEGERGFEYPPLLPLRFPMRRALQKYRKVIIGVIGVIGADGGGMILRKHGRRCVFSRIRRSATLPPWMVKSLRGRGCTGFLSRSPVRPRFPLRME